MSSRSAAGRPTRAAALPRNAPGNQAGRRGARAGRLAVGAVALLAALGAGADEVEQAFKDSTSVSSVLIPVTVRDGRGRLVANLGQEAFHLFIDDLPVPITSFWREGGLPLSLAFVLDTSGSMGTRKLNQAREVMLFFARRLRPEDQVSLITFGGGEVKRRMPFGADPALLGRILAPLTSWGTTALFDVLTVAPDVTRGARHFRRAVLLFTDGVDTASRFSAARAREVLEGLADPLYAFGIEPPPEDAAGNAGSYEALLREFAVATGGRYIPVGDASQLPAMGEQLRRELTMRYIIAVQPSAIGVPKWRRIRVAVKGAHEVVTREGYRGTLP